MADPVGRDEGTQPQPRRRLPDGRERCPGIEPGLAGGPVLPEASAVTSAAEPVSINLLGHQVSRDPDEIMREMRGQGDRRVGVDPELVHFRLDRDPPQVL